MTSLFVLFDGAKVGINFSTDKYFSDFFQNFFPRILFVSV